MPLEALRSVGEREVKAPPTQTVPSHFGRLPRQSQALQYGAVTKARAFRLQCPPVRTEGGVAEGRPRANQHGEQLSCAGSLAVKSTPILTNMLPFAGERASEELGLLEDSRRESPALRCNP